MIQTRAFRIYQDDPFHAGFEEVTLASPDEGELVVAINYSGINYKDALAGSGRAKILRKSPLTGGIDLAGKVTESRSPDFAVGDWVLANGSGLSETIDGGYASHAKIPAAIAIPIPPNLDARRAMLIGTAGFTAALSVMQMLRNGQRPSAGAVAVTGASGGVGSFAAHLLAQSGFEAVAVSRKASDNSPSAKEADAYLRDLGASEVIAALNAPAGDLAKATWGGGIDCLGGEPLANLIKTTKPQGNVAAVGLAQSAELHGSVLPFIIRGVNLLGITSANCPPAVKRAVWQALGGELRPSDACFAAVLQQEVALSDVPAHFERVLAGEVRGRILVDCRAAT